MHARFALLASAAVFFCTQIHAQELQVTLTGEACSPLVGNPCVGAGHTESPFTISYQVDTAGVQLSQLAFTSSGLLAGFVLSAPAPVTGFTETIGGQKLAGSPTSAGFSLDFSQFAAWVNGTPAYYLDIGVSPPITEQQLAAQSDPLEFILLTYLSTPQPLGGDAVSDNSQLVGSITVAPVSVPDPAPVILLLIGLTGLAISRFQMRPLRAAAA
jgi:hypothetical protein